jgi:glucokinase
MKQTISVYDFRDAFRRMNRENQFSYEGLGEIYEYLEEANPDMELDVIAICCDFTQCSLKEFKDSFTDVAIASDMTEEEKRETISEFIGMYGFWHAFVEDGKEIIFENF